MDLENTVIHNGLRLSHHQGLPYLEVVQQHVQGMPTRVATGKNVLREYIPVLTRFGWGLSIVPTEPDSADLALIETGYDYIRCGVTDLVIVSGDHAFVELASWARLHVVTHAGHLSRRLRLAATTVTYLPPIGTHDWQPATAA